MTSGERIVALVTDVVRDARATAGEKIALTAIRDLCVAKAQSYHPDLVAFLATARGLAAISITLSQLPHLIAAENPRWTAWTFVRTLQ